MRCLDKYGWPVELVRGRPVLNLLRRLIHTRKIVMKWQAPTSTPADDVSAELPGDAPDLRAELSLLRRRYRWAANELLACDYGDNPKGDKVGWHVYGWRDRSGERRIYGPSIDEAIDNELREHERKA